MENKLNNPIGVFDSGIGGLTVVKSILQQLPNENIVYFGDTARVPYGTKSNAVVREYTRDDVKILLDHNVKIIVVACNTVSAVALDIVTQMSNIPVVGMIMPGSQAALKSTKSNHIGIIGTTATINSKAYENTILQLNSEAECFSKACPLFVPLAEEGFYNHKATELIAKEYLLTLMENKIDTLILGCTHYPLLKEIILKVTESKVKLIDSGEAAAKNVKKVLTEKKLLNKSKDGALLQFYVSDAPQKISKLGEEFLGRKLGVVRQIHI
ncbi:MAG: glutamate racemase [Bacteroidetes bacterium]|nr:glutamate racemase [Bacteroidota bacterium]